MGRPTPTPVLQAIIISLSCLFVALAAQAGQEANMIVSYPAPSDEKPSGDYTVEADGKPVFVYTVGTLHGGPASFASFDFSGTVGVKVVSGRPVKSAKVLPSSFGIRPEVRGNEIAFSLSRPRNVTIEINDSIDRPLHLFANPLEADPPRADDPNVIYFKPGVHEVGTLKLKDNQTLYLTGGAILRPKLKPDEKPVQEKNWAGNKVYENFLVANGAKNVKVRGRGILDMSLLPWHARTALVFHRCTDVLVEGIIVLDAPAWVVAMFECRNVTVRNVKQICRRENSDGVDICNSQDVLVEGGFYRNNDDEVCVKTTAPPPAQESRNIVVRGVVVWNDRARGLGITNETRANISNVLFQDCDIIHDLGICSLAILVSDSGTMSDIRFEDIRVEDVKSTLVDCWIGSDMWGHDPTRGHIRGVVFRNVTVTGRNSPGSRLSGFDASHLIEDVTFDRVRIGGKLIDSLASGKIAANAHTRNIRFLTGATSRP